MKHTDMLDDQMPDTPSLRERELDELGRKFRLPAHFRDCPGFASEDMSERQVKELREAGGVYEIDGCWYQVIAMPIGGNRYRVRLKGT